MDRRPSISAFTLLTRFFSTHPSLRAILSFSLLLMIPVALTFWFRRRARKAPEEAKPAVVFAYRRFMLATVLAGVLVWWTAIDLLQADSLALRVTWTVYAYDDGFAVFLSWFLLWIPPLAVFFLCLVLSPVHSLRGIVRTRVQALKQSFWTVANFAIPLALFVAAIVEMFYSVRKAIILFAVWVLASRLTRQHAVRSAGTELRAVTSGELRDRAFEIAAKAGAKLNQIYVLPAEKNRTANAFAHRANNIYLTDYLLKNLNKNEVDAVIGHEATHLKKRHANTRSFVLLVAIILAALAGDWVQSWTTTNIPFGPVAYGLFLFIVFFYSRRNEFAADSGAWKLTGDAEAMITALVKISRLNTMPIEWGKLDEKMLTHPSTLRRIKHLARLGNISEARIADLLNQSVAPPVHPYPLPESVLATGKIFSSSFKASVSWRYFWIDILSISSFASVIAVVAQHAHLSGRLLYGFLLFGFLFTFALHLAIAAFCPLMGMKKLEQRLCARLAKDSRTPAEIHEGLLVGLSPGSQPRIYEGNWLWDMGVLYVSNERLIYWGEETRFSLPRAQIMSVSLGPGPVGWFNAHSACVSWRDESGNSQVFNLRALRSRSIVQMSTKSRELAEALQKWLQGSTQAPGCILPLTSTKWSAIESIAEPQLGEVTSTSPKLIIHANQIGRIFLLTTLIATSIAILFGLRVPVVDEIAPITSPIDLNLSGAAFLYVLVTVWVIRVLQLLPYWRFRESVSGSAAGVPPAPARTAT